MAHISATSSPLPASAGVHIGSKYLVLLASSLAVFMSSLDTTIVNVAFPAIGESFSGASRVQLSWVLNGYIIAFAALLIVSGRVADRVGRKRVFLPGLALFTIASAACGLAPSHEALIVARVVQGGGAAIMTPAALGLLLAAWSAEERATAVALWGVAAALAAATGPSLGALIVDGPGWRWAFLMNVPIGLGAIALGRAVLLESRNPQSEGRLDLGGVVLITIAMGALALGIVQGREWGWDSGRTVGAFVVAAVSLGSLVGLERRHPAPIIDPALFQIPSFTVANVAMFAYAAGFFGILLANVLFLTTVWEYSVLKAGLAITPAPLLAALAAGPSGKYAARHGYRRVIVTGSAISTAGVAWLAFGIGSEPAYLREWLPSAVVVGFGVGLTFAHLSGAAVASVSPAQFAVASAISQTARYVGGMVGVAVIVAILGTPATPEAAYESFGDGYVFIAVAFAVCGMAGALLKPARQLDR